MTNVSSRPLPHSPEPWEIVTWPKDVRGDMVIVRDAGGQPVLNQCDCEGMNISEVNMARALVCVNACKGLTEDEIKQAAQNTRQSQAVGVEMVASIIDALHESSRFWQAVQACYGPNHLCKDAEARSLKVRDDTIAVLEGLNSHNDSGKEGGE